MRLNVGINYEGVNDIDVITTFVRRIFKLKSIDAVFVPEKVFPSYTSIIPKLKRNVKLLYLGNKIDIAVLFTDQDKNEKSVRTIAIEVIKNISEDYFRRTVVGVANPHFEAWLISDANAVKALFGLDSTKPLVGTENPKFCLNAYHSQWKKKNKPSLAETKNILANRANLNIVSRNSNGFNHFKEDLLNVLEQFKSTKSKK